MPEIILEKTYKAKKEIMITEGVIFIDGIESDKITPCSFHPFRILSGIGVRGTDGKFYIKGE